MNDIFKLPEGNNRKPHEVALDWLISQNLKPGDVISAASLDDALCLVDPNTLPAGRKPQQRWSLQRLAELQQLRDQYEIKTGEVLVPAHGGGWLVCPSDEVADTLMDDFFAVLFRLYRKTSARLFRAKKEGVSHSELAKRNAAIDKVSQLRAFASRESRISLSD